MKTGILSALEGLEGEKGVSTTDVFDHEVAADAILESMVAEQELHEALEELDEARFTLSEAQTSIEQLEHIRASIEEFGISGPTMTMADANGELSTAGLVAAYETLDNSPQKDSNAEEAVQKLDAALEGFLEKIGNFFKNIGFKISKAFKAFGNFFRGYNGVLKSVIAQLKSTSIDSEKFAKTNVYSFSVKDLNTIMTMTNKVRNAVDLDMLKSLMVELVKGIDSVKTSKDDSTNSDELSATILSVKKKLGKTLSVLSKDNNTEDAAGVVITIGSDGAFESTNMVNLKIKREKKTLGELGWKPESVLEMSETILKMNTDAMKHIDTARKMYNQLFELVSQARKSALSFMSNTKSKRSSVVAHINRAVKTQYDITNAIFDIYARTYWMTQTIAINMGTIGKKAVKSTTRKVAEPEPTEDE